MNQYQIAVNALLQANEDSNKTIDELNDALDTIEAKDEVITELRRRVDSLAELLEKQMVIIDDAVVTQQVHRTETSTLRTQLKELQLLDPKRLVKVNKTQKATNVELKAKLATSEQSRRAAVKSSQAEHKATLEAKTTIIEFCAINKLAPPNFGE